MDLLDQVAIITGSSSGIGRVIAKRMAEAGANVSIAARRLNLLEELAEEIEEEEGTKALPIKTDMAEPSDIDNLVEETMDEYGKIDILVNNAGVNLAGGDPLEQSRESTMKEVKINFTGLYILSQEVAKKMLEREYGRIINISSIAADVGIPGMTVYGGTKKGVRGLTQALAIHLARHGINVNSISPGLTKVKRIEKVIKEKGDEIFDLERIPKERLARPEEIADTAVFLSSELSEYITGVNINVDGGVQYTAGMYL
ncbi:hypothetical protein AKJ56_01035 [candidate division MSBL1 archaeon SCGC-AAA382N08]|uniref:Short-chain dehydrogenase n=1 Tax=candidate division MSBL1 archaeon SCGC-AAA382N08 TaxID=1698285 RepID=A0A133VQ45_9EURY|nr:hypothetical protein AKJ56_01035 [candidate division MSBL1 archaeon SCGC-AAA382N08]